MASGSGSGEGRAGRRGRTPASASASRGRRRAPRPAGSSPREEGCQPGRSARAGRGRQAPGAATALAGRAHRACAVSADAASPARGRRHLIVLEDQAHGARHLEREDHHDEEPQGQQLATIGRQQSPRRRGRQPAGAPARDEQHGAQLGHGVVPAQRAQAVETALSPSRGEDQAERRDHQRRTRRFQTVQSRPRRTVARHPSATGPCPEPGDGGREEECLDGRGRGVEAQVVQHKGLADRLGRVRHDGVDHEHPAQRPRGHVRGRREAASHAQPDRRGHRRRDGRNQDRGAAAFATPVDPQIREADRTGRISGRPDQRGRRRREDASAQPPPAAPHPPRLERRQHDHHRSPRCHRLTGRVPEERRTQDAAQPHRRHRGEPVGHPPRFRRHHVAGRRGRHHQGRVRGQRQHRRQRLERTRQPGQQVRLQQVQRRDMPVIRGQQVRPQRPGRPAPGEIDEVIRLEEECSQRHLPQPERRGAEDQADQERGRPGRPATRPPLARSMKHAQSSSCIRPCG